MSNATLPATIDRPRAPELAPLRIEDIQTIAAHVARSRLYGMDETQAFTLMMLAHSKGLHPIQAVERYHVIQGKPTMKADAMLAEFQSRGGVVTWGRHDGQECHAVFNAPGVGEPVPVSWTTDDAKRAELLKNPMWSKYPRQMLRARVISEGIRMTMPGIIIGIYTPEEVADFAPAQAEPARVESGAHHAINHDNGTGHGRTGAYAPPASVAAYKAWRDGFVQDINAKWLDKWTSEDGQIHPKAKELLSTFQVSGHLLKWAVSEGLVNAPEDARPAQRDGFVGVAWDKNRGGLIQEAEGYARRKWKEARVEMEATDAPAEPEPVAAEDVSQDADPDMDYGPDAGSGG